MNDTHVPEQPTDDEARVVVQRLPQIMLWNDYAEPGVTYAVHKFSLCDAIERASVAMDTDYTSETEFIVVGRKGRVVVATLPLLIRAAQTAEGWMPIEKGMGLVGMLGQRKVYWSKSPSMDDSVLVCNGRQEVEIRLISRRGARVEGWPEAQP